MMQVRIRDSELSELDVTRTERSYTNPCRTDNSIESVRYGAYRKDYGSGLAAE